MWTLKKDCPEISVVIIIIRMLYLFFLTVYLLPYAMIFNELIFILIKTELLIFGISYTWCVAKQWHEKLFRLNQEKLTTQNLKLEIFIYCK